MGEPNKKAHIQHDHSQPHVPSIDDGVQTCYQVRLTSRIDCGSTGDSDGWLRDLFGLRPRHAERILYDIDSRVAIERRELLR